MKWLFKLKYFFGIFPNDWRVVWSEMATIHWTDVDIKGNFYYIIEFSESRDAFKLRCEGESLGRKAKEHKYYKTALQKLAEYNNELISIRFTGKSNKIIK